VPNCITGTFDHRMMQLRTLTTAGPANLPTQPKFVYRYPSGSTGDPFTRTSKCRCGPVLLPVLPE
jgi:hypothetical protein